MADIQASLALKLGEVKDEVHGVRQFLIEQQRELQRYRGEKHMRIPLLLQGPVAGAAINLGESSGQVLGPRQGFAWSLKRLVVDGLSTGSGSATFSSTATGSIAAGAGSAALANGISATGFTLSFSAAPSTTGTAVLSNVTGGPYTFNIPSGQTSPYTVVFPNPVTAASAGVAPTLTIAGLGTGAGTIILYGSSFLAAVAPDQVQLFRSSNVGQPPLWTFSGGPPGLPPQVMPGKLEMTLWPGDTLNLVNLGALAATGTIRLSGEATEVPAEMLAKLT